MDSIYAPPQAHLGSGHDRLALQFYVVAPLKMIVLMIGTLGAYTLYWHYQNWFMYRREAQHTGSPDSSLWPVARAVFSIFFTHSLLRKVCAHGQANERQMPGKPALTATVIVLLTLVNWYLSFAINEESPYYLLTTVISMLMLVPSVFAYHAAQKLINASSGDPAGAGNAQFTAANIVWLLIGAAVWALLVIGMVAPKPA